MYLQRLVEFADSHSQELAPVGYKKKKVDWYVDIIEGKFEFDNARGDESEETVPDRSRSSGIMPILLADKAEYVFGLTEKGANEKKKERVKKQFQAFIDLLEQCYEATNLSVIKKIMTALQQLEPHEIDPQMKPSDIIVFQDIDDDDEFPHEFSEIEHFWQDYLQKQSAGKKQTDMQCMICGEIGPVLERHTIEFPLGPERTKLISANATAYESHGLKASSGSPVCYVCEQKYGKALHYLLQRYPGKGKNRQPGGPHMYRNNELTYVYWIRKGQQVPIGEFGNIRKTQNAEQVRNLITSTFKGREYKSDFENICTLTLSSNKARMVVRDYQEDSLESIKKNIERYFQAQDVGADKFFGIWQFAGLMFYNSTNEQMKYALTEWTNWMMRGKPLTPRVLIPLLKQIQSKGKMYSIDGSAVQSWLISQKGEGTMDVNNEKDSELCGRLFAVLEKLQQEATNSNETIASRFFGSASTAPSSVFGLLIKNSQAHLNKVRKEKPHFYNGYSKRIEQISASLREFPTVLSLQQQAEFALGYYRERQDQYTKRSVEK